ncbi:unnamed protein product [Gordionus sp. m RMFG-2023]
MPSESTLRAWSSKIEIMPGFLSISFTQIKSYQKKSEKHILEMGKELLTGETPKMKFFLTYKTSQDHLELYFCSIRSRGGFNDNPSAYQQYNLIINKSCDDRIKKDECL